MKIVKTCDTFNYFVDRGEGEIRLESDYAYRVFGPNRTRIYDFVLHLEPNEEDFEKIANRLGAGQKIRITLEIGDEV